MGDKEQTVIGTVRVEKLACIECQHVMDVSHLPPFSPIKCPACNTQQTVPTKFGSFLLLNRLGSGGMGVIFHAVDRELGRHVALKVMKRSLGDNTEFVKSFKHEAQAAAALNHRNVVQIYSFGQVEGQPYIVMELVDGGRLDEMIGGGVALDETRALEIHLEVTEGLHAASQVGLVHGDIKPANILFGQTGEAKVVDFGLASFIGQQQQQGGQVWGTPYYIAPEKARGKKVDFRSDIYSLGATLFHVLAGQPPFDGATPMDVVTARLNHPAPSLLTLQPGLHPATVAMVARMLEAEPTMRYPSYDALLVDMRAALNSSRVPLKKTGPSSGILAGRLAKQYLPRRIPWKIVGLAAGGVVVISLAAWGLFASHQKRVQVVAQEAQQQGVAEIQARGQETFARLATLAQTIYSNAAPLLAYGEKADQLAKTVPDQNAALIELREAVERVATAANDVDDQQALAQDAWYALEAATNVALAGQNAARLEASFDNLVASFNAVEQTRPAVLSAWTNANAVHAKMREALANARKAEALAAAKKREEEAARQLALKAAQEAEALRPIVTQRELDMVDRVRAANALFIAQRQFDEAARASTQLQADLTLDESKAYCRAVTDAYRSMSKLKTFLVKSIQGAPYANGWISGDSTRDIVAADLEKGITIALGSSGRLVMAWDQVNIQQMWKMAGYYMNNTGVADKERAEVLLGIALFCYESGMFKMAENAGEAAYKADPAIKDEIQRLMPGLLAEP